MEGITNTTYSTVQDKNIKILKYLENIKHFIGCFSIKSLPPLTIPSSMMVIVKEHWLALIFLPDKCLYFDSTDTRCNRSLIKYIQTKYSNRAIIHNDKVLQHEESKKCAEFCIAFLKSVDSVDSYNLFLENFEKCSMKNDDVVKTYL